MGVLKKFRQSLDTPTLFFLQNFKGAFARMDPVNIPAKFEVRSWFVFGRTLQIYLPSLKSLALTDPEIIAIAVLGWGYVPQSRGRGGRRGSAMVPFERAFCDFL